MRQRVWRRVIGLGLVVVSLQLPCAFAASIVPPNPVAYWAANGNALDSAGTNDGTLQGGAGFGAGLSGQAFSLDGVDDYVNVPDAAALDFGSGDMSMFAWIKTTGTSDMRILTKGGGGVPLYQLEVDSGGGANAFIRDGSNVSVRASGTTEVTDGAWHMVVGVRSGNVLQIWVDGVLEAQANHSVGSTDNNVPLTIGQFGNNSLFFAGLIDEVALYDRALSAAEIKAAYAAGIAVPEPAVGAIAFVSLFLLTARRRLRSQRR